ncbi:Diguanylate Cyclase and Two-component system sensory domain-containing protein [Natronoarchaeum philippinense]|uniref:Diguanylate Cyclase and Two-component system sensory domain-containing protein n=1 Tax=Natronoarchaeum philippinense TaxID=558529 RepID=A0A285NV59_NATPI|nr:DICT sensory domain-containing protein [Natronoarchaeum philippinense]SNZ13329.1 Diguanylate Cyclase and Two-component system sensory domain-containing protein [Natronoarchaeum philippinense]
MTFEQFIGTVAGRDLTLRVVNRTELDPVYGMLEDAFGGQDVVVEEVEDESELENEVQLVESGDALAVSSLTEVRDSVLTVNSDLYITGSRPLEDVDTPDVIAELGDTTFTVDGHQKYLLIQLSREIEAMALAGGEGTVHTGFQYLSRIDDERGTLAAYETLGDSDLEVHVYGVPDADPFVRPGVELHGIDDEEIRDSWFVTYTSDRDDIREAALVAYEREQNVWDGFWTFEPELVAEVEEYIESEFL